MKIKRIILLVFSTIILTFFLPFTSVFASTLYSNDFTSQYTGWQFISGTCNTSSSGLQCTDGTLGIYTTSLGSSLSCLSSDITINGDDGGEGIQFFRDGSNNGHNYSMALESGSNIFLNILGLGSAQNYDTGYPTPTGKHNYSFCQNNTGFSLYVDNSKIYTFSGSFTPYQYIGIALGSQSLLTNLVATDTQVNVPTPTPTPTPSDNPPTVNSLPNATINAGGTYSANGSFTDPDSTSWTATVDYNDGSGMQSLPLSGMNFSLNHSFSENGTYTISVRITDNQGATGIGTAIVTVNNTSSTILYENNFKTQDAGWQFTWPVNTTGACNTSSNGLQCSDNALGIYVTSLGNSLMCLSSDITINGDDNGEGIQFFRDNSNNGHNYSMALEYGSNIFFNILNSPDHAQNYDTGYPTPTGKHNYEFCQNSTGFTLYVDNTQIYNFSGSFTPYQYIGIALGSKSTLTNLEASNTLINIPTPTPTPSLVTAINAGGDTQGNFVADIDNNGGTTYSSSANVDTSQVANPAPQAVYQTVRYGNTFSYTIPNLTANANYTVRLHFNELYWGTALSGNSGGTGSRVFNVAVNGTNVLNNFDIYQTAGGANIANIQQFPTTADGSGNITIQFTTVTDNAMVNGIEVYSGTLPSPTPTPTPTPASSIAINSGGSTAGNFITDTEFSGGQPYTSTASVDTTGVTNPAPQAVYQSVRYGNSFTYNIKNLIPNANFNVKLHFNELYWGTALAGNSGGAGSRVFNVSINGSQVLNNFDIFQTAGGANKATVETFPATSDANGNITIGFTTVTDNAMVNGIEISQ